jgi:hypothetical protein
MTTSFCKARLMMASTFSAWVSVRKPVETSTKLRWPGMAARRLTEFSSACNEDRA